VGVGAGAGTPILDDVRTDGLSDDFIDHLTKLTWKLTESIPSPTGGGWQSDDIDDLVGDLLIAKYPALFLAIQDMESDNQLKKWLKTTAWNFLNDKGRATLTGRLTRRVERVVTDVDGLAHDKTHLYGSAAGHIDPNDAAELLRQTHAIETVTDWWADEGEDPTPGARNDIIVLARCIADAASGPVPMHVAVEVIAQRLSLPLRWNVEEIDVEKTTLAVIEADVPPADAEAAVRLLANLSDNELAALPHYANNPDISSDELGAAIGRGRSTGNTVKNSLVARLMAFAEEDPGAEGALRHIGREILAGQMELPGRSDEGTEEGDHA